MTPAIAEQGFIFFFHDGVGCRAASVIRRIQGIFCHCYTGMALA